MAEPLQISVRQLNQLAARVLDIPQLRDVWVEGECSRPKLSPGGHLYFTLKDSFAQVSCVMFRSQLPPPNLLPREGEALLCRSQVSLYQKGGTFQLQVKQLTRVGQGQLWQQFQLLKEKLEQAGYFADDHKKPLPFLPRVIGIVTSPSGAAIHDIVEVSLRRCPGLTLQLIPVRVQGEGAAQEIAAAIDTFNQFGVADLLIVGRGGGSLEDLWAFNEVPVAEAIFRSKIPVISAVGHESDFSIADFVADRRAPTPSAAAELAVPDKSALKERLTASAEHLERAFTMRLKQLQITLQGTTDRLRHSLTDGVTRREQDLDQLRYRLLQHSPRQALAVEVEKLSRLEHSLRQNWEADQEARRRAVQACLDQLKLLNPWQVLERGYTVAMDPAGHIISRAADLRTGEPLSIHFTDGEAQVSVNHIQIKERSQHE